MEATAAGSASAGTAGAHALVNKFMLGASLSGANSSCIRIGSTGAGAMSVINVHVGGCGLRTGAAFWQALGCEHGIDVSGAATSDKGGRRQVYFDECEDGTWRPRAVLVDTVPGTCAVAAAVVTFITAVVGWYLAPVAMCCRLAMD